MGVALRLLEGFVAGSGVGFTIVWGWALSKGYSDFQAFVGDTVPFPLILPAIVTLVTIINIELLTAMLSKSGDKEAVLTHTEKRLKHRVEMGTRSIANWNSRWDTQEEEKRD